MTYIGRLIKKLRAEKKIKATDLAKELEISTNYLSRLENGADILSMRKASDLAYALDIDREDVMLALRKDYIRKLNDKFDEDLIKNKIVIL